MIRFLLIFGVLAGASRWEAFVASFREPYCELLARSLVFVFSTTGLDPVRAGPTIEVGFGRGLTIVPSCDGLVLILLFVAGVAATPIQRSLRPYLFAIGFLAVLVVVNWFRLIVLAVASFYRPDVFELLHVYVIQGLLIFTVVLMFLVWLTRIYAAGPSGMIFGNESS